MHVGGLQHCTLHKTLEFDHYLLLSDMRLFESCYRYILIVSTFSDMILHVFCIGTALQGSINIHLQITARINTSM